MNGISTLEKDQYGIPILPDFAELLTEVDKDGNTSQKRLSLLSQNTETDTPDFDGQAFALWSTIMNGPTSPSKSNNNEQKKTDAPSNGQLQFDYIEPKRKVRLEEFMTAFLGFSLFDIADVWAPLTDANGVTSLYNVFAANSEETDQDSNVVFFKTISKTTVIQPWSGAVGRAHSTGTAVWSTNMVSVCFCTFVLHHLRL